MLDRMRAYVLSLLPLDSFSPLCSLPLTVWRQGHVLRFWSWSHCSDASHPGVLLLTFNGAPFLIFSISFVVFVSIYHQKLNLAKHKLALLLKLCCSLTSPISVIVALLSLQHQDLPLSFSSLESATKSYCLFT